MQDGLMELMRKNGHISGSNAAYVEELYEEFLTDPLLISEQWRDFFKSLSAPEEEAYSDVSHSEIKKHFEALGKVSRHARVLSNEEIVNSEHESKQVEVLLLISSYRVRGHQKANYLVTNYDLPRYFQYFSKSSIYGRGYLYNYLIGFNIN